MQYRSTHNIVYSLRIVFFLNGPTRMNRVWKFKLKNTHIALRVPEWIVYKQLYIGTCACNTCAYIHEEQGMFGVIFKNENRKPSWQQQKLFNKWTTSFRTTCRLAVNEWWTTGTYIIACAAHARIIYYILNIHIADVYQWCCTKITKLHMMFLDIWFHAMRS